MDENKVTITEVGSGDGFQYGLIFLNFEKN